MLQTQANRFADVKLPRNSILRDEEEHGHRHAIEHSKETREETSRHATLTTPPRAKLENEERWQLVKKKKSKSTTTTKIFN